MDEPMRSAPVDDSAGSLRPPARPHRPGWLPDVDTARCTGCGWCVAACDIHLLSLEVVQWRKSSVLHEADRCTGCSDCAVVCPFHAITMRKSGAKESIAAHGPSR
ncbi:Ferredoxin I (plasmid) [Variovorax sp. SRS16]|nr:Ferredoxin I [Variovorax sp. SRS16]